MSSRSRIPRRWTKAEDAILSSEAESQLSQGVLRDWSRIAAKLSGRTNKDCRKRWTKICTLNLKKGAWSPEEDEKLKKAVSEIGQHWTQVAQVVGSRHADQCAKRWNHSLDPKLDHSKWTPELDELLLQAIAVHGRVWKTIGEKNFPSRSATDIKNRYLIVARRQKLLPSPASSKPTTPNFALPDLSSTTNSDDKPSDLIQETDCSPASTWDLDNSDDEYSMTDSKFSEPPRPLVSEYSPTKQTWLSSPNTPCDFTFINSSSATATPGSEIFVSAKDASLSTFPISRAGAEEDFKTNLDGLGCSSNIGELTYPIWEQQNIPSSSLEWEPHNVSNNPQSNCMPSLALVAGRDTHVHPAGSDTLQSPLPPYALPLRQDDHVHAANSNTVLSPLLQHAYLPHAFTFNDLATLPPLTDPLLKEPDHIYTDHTSVPEWQTMNTGVDMDMDVHFDVLGTGSIENSNFLGPESMEDSDNNLMLEFPETPENTDLALCDGAGVDDSLQLASSPLNTMILEDVHPDVVRDLMCVLLKSKERVKMRMYSQE